MLHLTSLGTGVFVSQLTRFKTDFGKCKSSVKVITLLE